MPTDDFDDMAASYAMTQASADGYVGGGARTNSAVAGRFVAEGGRARAVDTEDASRIATLPAPVDSVERCVARISVTRQKVYPVCGRSLRGHAFAPW